MNGRARAFWVNKNSQNKHLRWILSFQILKDVSLSVGWKRSAPRGTRTSGSRASNTSAKNQLVTKNEEGRMGNALETGGARFWKSKEDVLTANKLTIKCEDLWELHSNSGRQQGESPQNMEKPDGGERQSLGFESRYGEGIGYAGLSLRTVRAGEQRPCRLGQEVGHTEEMEDATENAKQSQRLVGDSFACSS